MTRQQAKAILSNQPRTALQAMALALQFHTHLNTKGDWNRLLALHVLGYKVRQSSSELQERIDQ